MHFVPQGEAEWNMLRVGRVTASALDNLLTPQFKIRTGEMPESYLFQKVVEAHKNRPLEDEAFSTYDTERGKIVEDEARREFWYNYKPKDMKLIDVGFVESDDGRFGCSPDALVGEVSGLEIKCPKDKTHAKYRSRKALPPEYAVQVHGSMYATGRSSWYFMSYAIGLPPFVINVQRDERICSAIAQALAVFYVKFDAELADLKAAA